MVTIPADSRIVFFDGVCGLCNSFVDFLLPRDSADQFLYSPLQGNTAEQLLPANLRGEELSTMVFYDRGQIYLRSDAVLRILSQLGWFWRLISLLRFLPASLRDAVYQFIADRRYRWFGKKEACRLPSTEERRRFLN